MTVPARSETSTWLRIPKPSPAAPPRLIVLPHAGGSASCYLPLLAPLWPRVEVLAVQYPGRQDRLGERPISDLHALADCVAEELEPWTDLPYTLFGHSFGATVGYEVALRLGRSGRVP